jgi:hypothetical protein
MRRYTGQRALYEAWSLSRSKPKRNGLLDRLRPQLEKLHAATNGKLKAAAPPRSPSDAIESRPPTPRQVVPEPNADVRPQSVKVDVPAVLKLQRPAEAPKREETRPGTQLCLDEIPLPAKASAGIELKAKTPKIKAPKIELPKIEPKVELPEVESEEIPEVPAVVPMDDDDAGLSDLESEEPAAHAATVEPEPEGPSLSDEPPRSLLEIATGLGPKAGRIADRLKAFRSQRNENAGPVKDAKLRPNTNLRPKPIQFNFGQIDIAIPYVYAILAALVVVIVLVAAFRIGQVSGGGLKSGQPDKYTIAKTNPVDPAAVSAGNNRIVIAQHADRDQLTPLMQYFLDHGIETGTMKFSALKTTLAAKGLSTKAIPAGEGYLLMTVKLYNNVDKPGSDGYNAKQKIVELGEKYHAPDGTAQFSPDTFRQAYGLKVQ